MDSFIYRMLNVILRLGVNEKLKIFTNWQQQYTLDEGLEETINWFSKKDNLQKYKSGQYNV